MTRVSASVMFALLSASCFTEVDNVLEDDYRDWYSVTAVGEVPGHGDSYRVMFANDDARSWSGSGEYPADSVIVKEIYHRDGDAMGEFRYLGIMRKLSEAPDGVELDNGWLFTYRGELDGGVETHRPRCWKTCHQNAPFRGTFLNWADPTPPPPPDAGVDAS